MEVFTVYGIEIILGSKGNAKDSTKVVRGTYAKCILVMDKKDLALANPPLLDRFEKQIISIDDTLDESQQSFVEFR